MVNNKNTVNISQKHFFAASERSQMYQEMSSRYQHINWTMSGTICDSFHVHMGITKMDNAMSWSLVAKLIGCEPFLISGSFKHQRIYKNSFGWFPMQMALLCSKGWNSNKISRVCVFQPKYSQTWASESQLHFKSEGSCIVFQKTPQAPLRLRTENWAIHQLLYSVSDIHSPET